MTCNSLYNCSKLCASMPSDTEKTLIENMEELNRRLKAIESHLDTSGTVTGPPVAQFTDYMPIGKSGHSLVLNITQICKDMGLGYGDKVVVRITKLE